MALLYFLERHYSHYKDHHYSAITAQNMLLGMYVINRTVCIMLTALERSERGSNPKCQPLATPLVYLEEERTVFFFFLFSFMRMR